MVLIERQLRSYLLSLGLSQLHYILMCYIYVTDIIYG